MPSKSDNSILLDKRQQNLDWELLDDPKNFHLQVTDGSIVVIDEVQRLFPVRSPKASVPEAMQSLETHRHRGLDIYFITQHPNLLDHHARRLVGRHFHLQRIFGFPASRLYSDEKLIDTANPFALKQCDSSTFKFPKNVYPLYKSAEIHTVKPRIPKKLLWIIPALMLLGGGFYFFYTAFLNKHTAKIQQNQLPTSSSSSTQLPPATSAQIETKAIDWTKAFIPAIQGLPYTAPVYKELAKPVALPVVAGCVATKTRCKCYTQQATVIDMDDELCRLNVKHHPYNPFKQSEENKQLALSRNPQVSTYTPQQPSFNQSQAVVYEPSTIPDLPPLAHQTMATPDDNDMTNKDPNLFYDLQLPN